LTVFYNAGVKSWDVIIVGGGIIGLSLAIELRKNSATVLVVERGEPGREASYAAGGMLVDNPLETAPALQELATASTTMYPEFVHELQTESGKAIDFRRYGTIFFPESGQRSHPALQAAGLPAPLAEFEPSLAVSGRQAFYLAERSVDPRQLMVAALHAAKRRGVDMSSGDAVTAVNISHGHVSGVITNKTSFAAPSVVNCAGAWSGRIAPDPFPTRPVKGQMLYVVSPARELLKHVVRSPEVYVIPRSDGRLLIGTTLEEAGFDKRTDPDTIQRLRQAAVALIPELKNARILEDWAGLRPGTPDGLPILGATSTPGYYIATGHFRDGILLAPVTARIMGRVLAGQNPVFDLDAFSPGRF
jgi:glycine oxidase